MIDTLVNTLAALTKLPPEVLAIAAGTLASWGITQRAKFWLPARWSSKARELATQATAFAAGFAAVFALFPAGPPLDWFTQNVMGLVAALIVGLWSPALWNIAMFFVGLRWPLLRERLSQDNRT